MADLGWWEELQKPGPTIPCSSHTHGTDPDMHDPAAPAGTYIRYGCLLCRYAYVRPVCDRMAERITESTFKVRCSGPGCGAIHEAWEVYAVIARI